MNILNKKYGFGSAKGKIILSGEHSVLFNGAAIVIPLPFLKTFTYIKKKKYDKITISCRLYKGNIIHSPKKLLNVKLLILNVLDYLKKNKKKMHFKIITNFPDSCGFGSSASVAVSIVKAIFDFFKINLKKKILLKFVNFAENICHNISSGVDIKGVMSKTNKIFLYKKNKKIKKNIKINFFGLLIIANIENRKKNYNFFNKIKNKISKNKKIFLKKMNDINFFTYKIKDCLKKNLIKKCGYFMNKVHHILNSLNFSTKKINNFINLVKKNGALGAKITGAGGGGNIIILSDNYKKINYLNNILIKNGIKKIWIYDFNLKKNNVD